MAECPSCHSSIEITDTNFGTIFTCPHCQAVFFIGWDGVPEEPQMGSAIINIGGSEPTPPPVEAPIELGAGPTEPQTPAWEPPPLADMSPEISPTEVQEESSVTNFQDIVDYGNSPELKSTLTYSISIQGIEIFDTREKFKEAISDSRFGWDVEAVLKQIENGSINFRDLSPAKAVALINRIKYLPIRITWRQNVLS